MGRIEERRERNKKLIADVDNLFFDMNRTWEKDIRACKTYDDMCAVYDKMAKVHEEAYLNR